MTDHLSIEIFGMLRGAADGPLAIGALAVIVLAATVRLWWPRRADRIGFGGYDDRGRCETQPEQPAARPTRSIKPRGEITAPPTARRPGCP
jgi:hypothetical protein